uniref:14-3-3 domain-containing protein n=1 Tax=Salix viminalis TaxID=40686 RepID=A0A6N2KBC0_SALVM
MIGSRHALWRIISSIKQKEENRGNGDLVSMIRDYKSKIGTKLSSICDRILKVLDSRVILAAKASDSKFFYLKMKGDYHRYLAKFKTGAERKEVAENGRVVMRKHEHNRNEEPGTSLHFDIELQLLSCNALSSKEFIVRFVLSNPEGHGNEGRVAASLAAAQFICMSIFTLLSLL